MNLEIRGNSRRCCYFWCNRCYCHQQHFLVATVIFIGLVLIITDALVLVFDTGLSTLLVSVGSVGISRGIRIGGQYVEYIEYNSF